MMSYPLILGASIIGALVLGIVIYIATGSFMSVLVILAIIGILLYVLHTAGFFTYKVSDGTIDLDFHEKPVHPSEKKNEPAPIFNQEVFYVGPNNYQYEEAKAVCAAYGADLATYDQLMEAYSRGADWCGYGWTLGGMALYPTQQSTWETLQQEVDQSVRTRCGRPGINGGYFDPKTKFGVNCYGTKPKDSSNQKYPLPVPGTDTNTFNHMVNKFKNMINRIPVFSFNRLEWSEYPTQKTSLPNKNES